MDTVLRAATVYVVLLVIFRLAGRRTLGSMTTFDLVLTLIISETVQEALIDDDHSMTAAFILIVTLITLDIGISLVARRSPGLTKLVESTPMLLVENGTIHQERLAKERVDLSEIMAAARESHGLERFAQIKHAILEKGGSISIVPNA